MFVKVPVPERSRREMFEMSPVPERSRRAKEMMLHCQTQQMIYRQMQLLYKISAPSRYVDKDVTKFLHLSASFTGQTDHLQVHRFCYHAGIQYIPGIS